MTFRPLLSDALAGPWNDPPAMTGASRPWCGFSTTTGRRNVWGRFPISTGANSFGEYMAGEGAQGKDENLRGARGGRESPGSGLGMIPDAL